MFDPTFRIIRRSGKVGGLVAFKLWITRCKRIEIVAHMNPFSAVSAYA